MVDKIKALVAWLVAAYGATIDVKPFHVTGLSVKKTDERGIQLDGLNGAAASGVKFTPDNPDTAALDIGAAVSLAIDPLAVHASRDAGTGQLRVTAYMLADDASFTPIKGSVTFFYNGCKSAILGKTKRGGKSRLILTASAETASMVERLAAEIVKRAAAGKPNA